MILFLKTDSPLVNIEISDDHGSKRANKTWEAGRELSQQLFPAIIKMLHEIGQNLSDLKGIGVYAGPGSYTGLRIGFSVANALGYSYDIPVVAEKGDEWKEQTIKILNRVNYYSPAQPVYGGAVHTTKPKK